MTAPITLAADPGQAFLFAPADVQRAVVSSVLRVEVQPRLPWTSSGTIPAELVAALDGHRDTYGLGREGLVSTARDKGPVRKTTFNGGTWKTPKEKASVHDATLHWLWHYASLLIRYGESVKTVQARLGRATAAETLDTYGHLRPDSDDRTREAAAAALWVPDTETDWGTTGGTTGP